MAKVTLYADPRCWKFREDHPEEWKAFGCGPGGFGDKLVPDTMYGLNVSEACRIHDWYYRFYPDSTPSARKMADYAFRNNLIRIVEAKTKNRVLRWVRKRRCQAYYAMVRALGGPAFYSDRNEEEFLKEVEV